MDDYFKVRFKEDVRRKQTWVHLTKYFQKYIFESDSVLELGAGYCYFINSIKAEKRFAIDIERGIENWANPDVRAVVGDVKDLSFLAEDSVDVIFASNLLEHLEWHELMILVKEMKRVLSQRGKVIVLQPNFALMYKSYFDDYTHRTVFTDKSISDWFESNGFKTKVMKRRFMPSTIKGKLGNLTILIPFYLKLPWKPFAGQMFAVFEKNIQPTDLRS